MGWTKELQWEKKQRDATAQMRESSVTNEELTERSSGSDFRSQGPRSSSAAQF